MPNIFLTTLKMKKKQQWGCTLHTHKKNDKTFILINAILNFSLECVFTTESYPVANTRQSSNARKIQCSVIVKVF